MFILARSKAIIPDRLKANIINTFFLFKRLVGLPANTLAEIKIYKKILMLFFGSKEINIFEWGSGMSTIYYPKFLLNHSQNFQWHSIDNSKKWHNIILKKIMHNRLDKNVHLFLSAFLPFWERKDMAFNCSNMQKLKKEEQGYIDFPKKINKSFDLFIVDGRFRRRCLLAAYEMLAPNGIILLHDAEKSHYHSSLEKYKYGRFIYGGLKYPGTKRISKIWIGSLDRDLSKCII